MSASIAGSTGAPRGSPSSKELWDDLRQFDDTLHGAEICVSGLLAFLRRGSLIATVTSNCCRIFLQLPSIRVKVLTLPLTRTASIVFQQLQGYLLPLLPPPSEICSQGRPAALVPSQAAISSGTLCPELVC